MTETDAADALLQEWHEKADELEGRPEEIRKEQDGFYRGGWDAACERAEPELKRKTIQRCIDDLDESTNSDEFLESLAEWRKDSSSERQNLSMRKESSRLSSVSHI